MDPAPSHLDQIAALLAAPPPRKVPPALQRAATRQSAPLLFVLVGALVGAFGMIFVVAFFPWGLTRQWRFDATASATAPGKIVAMERTGLSIGKSPVIRNTFEFSPPGLVEILHGTCYTTGHRWSEDDKVVVRYHPTIRRSHAWKARD